MSGRLEGKVAIVTGGATGIGEAICHKFVKEGASVVVCGLPDDPVQDVVSALKAKGGQAVGHAGDISIEAHAEECVNLAVRTFGKLDVLVNNAGVFLTNAEIDKYPVEDFDKTLRMNLRSAFLMTRFAIPYLKKTRGNIVNAGSESGYNGQPQNATYGGTKGFMHAFTQGVAGEQAKNGIRANCVCPGGIDTAWTRVETGPMDKKMTDTIVAATPLGRRGTAEEMANVYAFLASDEASYVTGALWLADGGITIGKGPTGLEAAPDVRKEPEGELGKDLKHTHDGLKNKEYHQVK